MYLQSVQGKQGSMLQRIDDLDRDNETLREELAELEDVKEQLEERIDRAEERRREIERECREQKVLQYVNDHLYNHLLHFSVQSVTALRSSHVLINFVNCSFPLIQLSPLTI